MSDRAQRARAAAWLYGQGMTRDQIARRLGISRSYAAALLSDPTGEKDRMRKHRYCGVCERCGARTDGSNGRAHAPSLCAACFRQRQREERRWTPEAIVAAIQTWAEEHGRPPRSHPDWTNAGPDHPASATVQYVFGLWADAVEAAGLPRPFAGHNRYGGKGGPPGGWTRESILNWIRDHADGDTPPTMPRTTGVAEAARREFGTWNHAVAAAGFTPRPQGQRRKAAA